MEHGQPVVERVRSAAWTRLRPIHPKQPRGNEPDGLAQALGTVARARGMSDIAKASGLTREALYKALRADAQPRLATVQKVMHALGLQLTAKPVAA